MKDDIQYDEFFKYHISHVMVFFFNFRELKIGAINWLKVMSAKGGSLIIDDIYYDDIPRTYVKILRTYVIMIAWKNKRQQKNPRKWIHVI